MQPNSIAITGKMRLKIDDQESFIPDSVIHAGNLFGYRQSSRVAFVHYIFDGLECSDYYKNGVWCTTHKDDLPVFHVRDLLKI